MKTERELFEKWCFDSGLVTNKMFFKLGGQCDEVSSAWEAWQASAQREGYKLVAVDPAKEHIHKFEEITVNGDDARKYICIYCGFEKSESFND